jgi:uncharacterized OsmC-like protein
MSAHSIKRWSVNVISDGQTPLKYFCDGRPLTQTWPATVENTSPVEFLLIAAAGCLALSARAVLTKRRLPRVLFEVVASGEKAPEPPSRLARLTLVTIFRGGISESDAAIITQEAKQLCTVSNTLLAGPEIVYQSRILHEIHAEPPESPARHAERGGGGYLG